MPFDEREFLEPGQATGRQRWAVAGWLFAVCFMLLVMIVLGGATRLTGSGLSIMEWAPLAGALPPWSEAEWHRLFALYQQIPQYKLLNAGIGLDGFKQIFWLEWTHRLWGRLIGVVFLVPLVVLAWRGALRRQHVWRLAVIFLLGGLQGAVGWFMVASGFFPDSTAVSPYRLVVHLVLALLLYAAIFWTALSVLRPSGSAFAPRSLRVLARLAAGIATLTIVAGGFVAGTHAGFTYNSFPLMDGQLVPEGYGQLSPFLRNLTENLAAVQFDHRVLATLMLVLTGSVLALAEWARVASPIRRAAGLLAIAVALQYALGIATLLFVVPVPLAAAHQGTAILVLSAALLLVHRLRPLPPRNRIPQAQQGETRRTEEAAHG